MSISYISTEALLMEFLIEFLKNKNKKIRPLFHSDKVILLQIIIFFLSEMLRDTSALILGMCGDNLTFSLTCHLKDLHFIRETYIISSPY